MKSCEQGFKRHVLVFTADAAIVSFLFFLPQNMVVLPCIDVIVVGNLCNVSHSFIGLLKDRNTDGHIVCSFVILSSLILQIRFLQILE